MEKTGNILIVDDDDDILTAGRLLLRRDFANVITCRDPEAVPRLLSEHAIDAVLLDMNFGPGESSGQQGLAWLSKILEIDADLVVVMITAHGSLNNAIEAMKRGATDFIVKPWQNEKVVATVSTAVKLSESRRQNQQLRQTNRALQQQSLATGTDIIGDSAAMREVMLSLIHI